MFACASIVESSMLHTEKIQSTVQKNVKTSRSGLEKASNATQTQNRSIRSVLCVGMPLTHLEKRKLLVQEIARKNTIKDFVEENRQKSQRLVMCVALYLFHGGIRKPLVETSNARENTKKRIMPK